MSVVLKLEKQPSDQKKLKEELVECGLEGKDLEAVHLFLTREGIAKLSDVDPETVTFWRDEVRGRYQITQAREHYAGLLEIAVLRFLQPSFAGLIREIDEKHHFSRAEGNKVKAFLMMKGIRHTEDITYHTRKEYKRFLDGCHLEDPRRYVKILDQVKLGSIEEENERRPFPKRRFQYENDVLYLGYHPDHSVAMEFYYVRDKEELVFDFSIDAPEKLKHQVFAMLNHCLEIDISRKNRREMYIVPLKMLFLYCAAGGIPDIETMTMEDMNGFEESIQKRAGTKTKTYLQIVNSTRRFLFLSAPRTNWDAHIWYMDRFIIKEERANPAYHIGKFSFCMIRNDENRDLFKSFMRYLIGISHRALNTVQGKYMDIRVFLMYCDREGIGARTITPAQVDAYMEYLDEKGNDSATFNKSLNSLLSFYGYLAAKGKISGIPIQGGYYRKKEFHLHHDRCVGTNTQMDLLKKLNRFPEHLRLMCIVIWATGLRVNEVCTLRSNAFSFEEGDAYVQVMQFKQVMEKKIPIPSVMYTLVEDYIERKGIRADEYIFRNKKGGPYYATTFRLQMQRLCRKYDVGDPWYIFRPHDFRHQLGTEMFDAGVSLQAIRDYHGHRDENMTKQYIDYMPSKVLRANREYYRDNPRNGSIEEDI